MRGPQGLTAQQHASPKQEPESEHSLDRHAAAVKLAEDNKPAVCSACRAGSLLLLAEVVAPAHAMLGGQVVRPDRAPAAIGVQLRRYLFLLNLLRVHSSAQ